MATTIILDLDGPLLDGRLRHFECYRTILQEHGYRPIEIDEYWAMKRRRVDRHKQLAASGAEAIDGAFHQRWLELIETPRFLALDRLQVGAQAKITAWRDRGVRLILATQRRERSALLRQLAACGLEPLFHHIVVCDHAEGGAGKAQRVRNVLGDAFDDCRLWIGDTEVDIEAARALRCPVWAVWCGLRGRSILESLNPDYASWGLRDVELTELGGMTR